MSTHPISLIEQILGFSISALQGSPVTLTDFAKPVHGRSADKIQIVGMASKLLALVVTPTAVDVHREKNCFLVHLKLKTQELCINFVSLNDSEPVRARIYVGDVYLRFWPVFDRFEGELEFIADEVCEDKGTLSFKGIRL